MLFHRPIPTSRDAGYGPTRLTAMTITYVFVTLLIGGFAAIGLAALAYLTMLVINSARPQRTAPHLDVLDTEFIESPTVKIVRRLRNDGK